MNRNNLPQSPQQTTPEMKPAPTALQNRIHKLLSANQNRSAELLALMELSLLKSSTNDDDAHHLATAATYELLGDACRNQQKYLSAVDYYRHAVEIVHDCHIESENSEEPHRHKVDWVRSRWEADLRMKECKSLSDSGCLTEASSVLERCFPEQSPFCTVEMHMLLGDLHIKLNRTADAVDQYRHALALDPYLMEAVEKLTRLGCGEEELLRIIDTGLNHVASENARDNSTTKSELQLPQAESLRINASARTSRHKNLLTASYSHYTKLLSLYPHHPYYLMQMAHVQQEMGHILASEQNYLRLRSIDPNWTEGMDRYAYLLYQLRMSRRNSEMMNRGGYLHYHYSAHGNRSEENKCSIVTTLGILCTDILDSNDKTPEGWNCLSLYHLSRDEHEKALEMVGKALSIQDEYAFSYYIQGTILQASHRPEHARMAFKRANELCCDVPSFEGMVESFLAGGRFKDAVGTAKRAISECPRDPRAITLVGLALAQSPTSHRGEGRERAKRALNKAIKLDHGALRPLFALVDLHASDGDYAQCLKLLQEGIENGGKVSEASSLCSISTWNKAHADVIKTKMGEIYTLNEDYGQALECYHIAIALNPHNGLAQQGMERVEKLLKGIDPDEEDGMGEGDEMNDEDGEYY